MFLLYFKDAHTFKHFRHYPLSSSSGQQLCWLPTTWPFTFLTNRIPILSRRQIRPSPRGRGPIGLINQGHSSLFASGQVVGIRCSFTTFFQQIFIKYLLCARECTQQWATSSKFQSPCSSHSNERRKATEK